MAAGVTTEKALELGGWKSMRDPQHPDNVELARATAQ